MELNVIRQADPQVADAIEAELNRQRSHIELIASENFVSPAVMAAMGSCLTNKYAEGYPAHRYYGGCECVDVVENLARDRAKQLFGCEYVNVQPHSGAQANTAVYFAMLQPGDTVMGMSLSNGGHLTHGSPVNLSGKYFHFVPYGVDAQGYIDYDAMRALALECKPKMIVSGASAYPRTIDFEKIRAICDEVGALMMVDIAHIAGLVAAGQHPSPVPYADFVTTTTHIYPPDGFPCLLQPGEAEIAAALEKHPCVCVGKPAKEGKITAADVPVRTLAELADYVLVEADGAHGRPAKAHADYEPVVPPEANQTILVFGLSALGQPIRACVHRPAIFAARCGVSEDDLLTPELAATFINDETPHTRVLLNQADTAERLALGRGMAAMLRGPVCLGTFRRSG